MGLLLGLYKTIILTISAPPPSLIVLAVCCRIQFADALWPPKISAGPAWGHSKRVCSLFHWSLALQLVGRTSVPSSSVVQQQTGAAPPGGRGCSVLLAYTSPNHWRCTDNCQ
jgi:hypothetical protein